jgi:hypothetical protein
MGVIAMGAIRFLVVLALGGFFSLGAAGAETIWVVQKNSKCVAVKNSAEQAGIDVVLRKCSAKDFPDLWLGFIDASRSGIGFGEQPHFASTGGNLKQTSGPVEWGGQLRDGKFKPQVAIIRRYYDDYNFEPPKKKQSLAIFRLLNNGTSCLVGDLGPSADQNKKARILAGTKIINFSCETSPDLLNIKG